MVTVSDVLCVGCNVVMLVYRTNNCQIHMLSTISTKLGVYMSKLSVYRNLYSQSEADTYIILLPAAQ